MRKVEREYNGQKYVELQFAAKLTSIASTPMENVNGKKFYPCSIEFADKNGEIQKTSAMMYEGNYNHGVTVGEEYAASAVKTSQGVLVRVSHLSPIVADRPNETMFDFDEVTAPAAAQSVQVPAGQLTD